MYVLQPRLPETDLSTLESQWATLRFEDAHDGHRHPSRTPSQYRFSRWYEWATQDRLAFQQALPHRIERESVVGWFLHYPANQGFLDLQTHWHGAERAGTVFAWALNDEQVIHIEGERVVVPRGEGIAFNLTTRHEVKRLAHDQDWACVMTLHPLAHYTQEVA